MNSLRPKQLPLSARSPRSLPKVGVATACKLARDGFSLLEVIIATAILAASAVMLTSMFSTGDRHTTRAEERTFAQMLCQSKLDELLGHPSTVLPLQAQAFRHFPGWVWSVEVEPTTLEGFVRVTVSVTRIPGMPTGADLSLAAVSTDTTREILDQLPEQPTFQLTRWLLHEGELEVGDDGHEPDTPQPRLGAQ